MITFAAEAGFSDTYRLSLDTNQYKKGCELNKKEYGAYACVFIAFAFQRLILEYSSQHWARAPQKFLTEIVQLLNQAIETGVKHHALYCRNNNVSSGAAKAVLRVFKNSLYKDKLVLMANIYAQQNVGSMLSVLQPKPKSGFFDLPESTCLTKFLTAAQITSGHNLIYNPSGLGDPFRLEGMGLARVYPSLGYIIGAEGHVISIVRHKNQWLLFNPLPEVRDCHFQATRAYTYTIHNGYALLFSGVNAEANLVRYLQTKLWKISSVANTYVVMKPKSQSPGTF